MVLNHIDAHTHQIGKEHHAENAVAQFSPFQIKSKGKSQCHGNNQYTPALYDVGQIGGVFQRMRGIHSEVTTAIGSKLLDGHDGGCRTLRHFLCLSFQRGQLHLTVKTHRCAFHNQYHAHDKRQRQKHTRGAYHQVTPEVSYRLRSLCRQCLHDARHGSHTGGSGDKLEEHDDEELREIGQSALTTIMLQIAVHHKRDAGVECLMARLPNVAVGIERQHTLCHQKQHTPYKPKEVNHEQSAQELLPVHLFIRIHTAQPVHPTFHGLHEVEARLFAFIHPGNVFAEWQGKSYHEDNL